MPSSVNDLVVRHKKVALDSNVLIYVLESDGVEADRAGELIDAIESGACGGVLASIGLMEVLSGPASARDGAMFELLATELRAIRNLRVVELPSEIAIDAAWLRGVGGLGLADAIHLATARASGATALVTNDHRIRSQPELEVVYLSDLIRSTN